VVERFIPGQNETPAMVVRLDQPTKMDGVTADLAVLELRYLGASWRSGETVHVELCDFEPESKPWKDRRRGIWVASQVTVRAL